MKRMAIQALINIAAIYLADRLFAGVLLESALSCVAAGVLLAMINLVLRPLVIILALPVNLITMGLFTLVVNTWMLMLADAFVPGLHLPGFWVALAAVAFIMVLNSAVPRSLK